MPAGSFPNHTSGDFICVPPKASFRLPGAFYETIVHELAHNAACRIMPRRMRRYRRIMGIPTRQLGIIKAIRGTQAARRSDGIARDASPVRRLAPALFFETQVGMDVDLRSFDGFMTKPESDHRLIDAVVQ